MTSLAVVAPNIKANVFGKSCGFSLMKAHDAVMLARDTWCCQENDHLINYFQTLCTQQFQATLLPDTLVSVALQGTQNAAMGETSSFEELCFQQLQPKYHQTHWFQRLGKGHQCTGSSHHATDNHTGFKGAFQRGAWCCEGWDQFLRRAVFSTAPSTVPPNTLVSKACKGQTYAAAKRNDHLINYFQTLCTQQFQATLVPDTLVSRAVQGTQDAAMGETSSFEELCFQQLHPQ